MYNLRADFRGYSHFAILHTALFKLLVVVLPPLPLKHTQIDLVMGSLNAVLAGEILKYVVYRLFKDND